MSSSEEQQLIKALNAIADNIVKILKINLDKDDFEIIKTNSTEIDEKKGFSKKISEWLYDFAKSGQVYSEDLNIYIRYTDITYLRNYFSNKKDIWRLRYRRKIGNDYLWVMMEMRPTENFSEDNKELYLYVQDIDKELVDVHIKETQLRRQLTEEDMLLRISSEILKAGMWRVHYDENGKELSTEYDENYYKLLGYESKEECEKDQKSFSERVHPDDRKAVRENIRNTVSSATGKRAYKQECRFMVKGGEYRWFCAMGELSVKSDGTPIAFVGILIDITEKKEYDNALNKVISVNRELEETIYRESREREVVNSIAGIYNTIHLFNFEEKICMEIKANEHIHAYFEMYKEKCDLQELIQGAMKFTAVPECRDNIIEFTDFNTLEERLKDKVVITQDFIGTKSGWVRASFIPVKYDKGGHLKSVLYTTMVVNEEKMREQRLIQLSERDTLTKLYNRRAYEKDLKKNQQEGLSDDFVIVSMDVNGLKTVNDTLGHAAGDELLQGTAQCILSVFKSYGNVYRTGGDEFMAIIHIESDKLSAVFDELDKTAAEFVGTYINGIHVSKGAAISKENKGMSPVDLEKIADEMMYKDKRAYYSECGVERRKR